MDQISTIPPLTPPTEKTVIRSGVVLVLALVIAAGFLIYFSEPVQEAISVWTLPEELRAAQFISYAGEGSVYGVGAFGYDRQELQRQPEVAAVFSNEVNAATRKGQWTVSPNKTYVAFTELAVPYQPRLPLSWQVTVTDVRTGSQRAVGKGFGVVFVDERTIARLTDTGIIVTNLEDGTEETLLPLSLTKVPETVAVSPNGALLAWSVPEEHAVLVYTVTAEAATQVTKYVGTFDTFTLNNDAIYLNRITERGTTVVRYPITADAVETVVHTLPASLGVAQLSFK